jgi:hypothetical protein
MSYENEIPDTRIKISPVKKMTYLFGEALAKLACFGDGAPYRAREDWALIECGFGGVCVATDPYGAWSSDIRLEAKSTVTPEACRSHS